MPKALCIAAMVISIVVFVLFMLDLILGVFLKLTWAPFHGAHATMDIVFAVCAAILGFMSWLTFREQV